MKIIENNAKSNFPIQVTCKQVRDKYGYTYGDKNDFCGSILEIEASDIKKHPWEKYMAGDSGIDYGVICPVCGKFIMLDANTLNARVKQEAPEVRIHGGIVSEC